jgi:hypothetical protein
VRLGADEVDDLGSQLDRSTAAAPLVHQPRHPRLVRRRRPRSISYFTRTLSEARKKPDPPVHNGANTASGFGCNNPASVNAPSRVVSLTGLTSYTRPNRSPCRLLFSAACLLFRRIGMT